ncbi:helix-turn-helix domain-containing protein [Clostridium kluyveri]|uniref:HTH cro/C1-type domain-containing protein n=1 Tax=Clostridium kluyveri TaxID=1534 RepID=A0A1L5FEU9_CLOKL|nr:helix-turn-helix transcriptional regulator [Clostridium kluyveri]APM41360.1 hypothetical protein BS101_21880 [Clostridium kluyveri]
MDNLINLDKLRQYMKENNISKSELAEIIGVNYTTVYRIFKGTRKPGVKFISKLLSSNISLKHDEIFL